MEAREYWSGLPMPPSGDLPDPGIKLESPALQADSLPPELPGKLLVFIGTSYTISFHLDVCFLEDSNEWKCKALFLFFTQALTDTSTIFFFLLVGWNVILW